MMKPMIALTGLMLVAQESLAGIVMGIQMPSALPMGMSGIVGIAAIALIVGTQVIKRKK